MKGQRCHHFSQEKGLHGPSLNSVLSDQSRSSGFGVERLQDPFGEVRGKSHGRVVGNGAPYSWAVWGTAVGPSVGSLESVSARRVADLHFTFASQLPLACV